MKSSKAASPKAMKAPHSGFSKFDPSASRDKRIAAGKELRSNVQRESHAGFRAHKKRPDPVKMLVDSSKGRMEELLPIRYGRMLQSPFAFYRGAASIMAEDLAHTPSTGLRVQACGDCHLVNFGGFATPERRIIFDINDFDETLPAPWEWDLKRLAASFVIACTNNEFKRKDSRRAVLSCVRSYRERMEELSKTPALEVWYQSIDAETVMRSARSSVARKRLEKRLSKTKERASEALFPKLAELKGGKAAIRDEPPLIFHPQTEGQKDLDSVMLRILGQYRETLNESLRVIFDRFQPVDSVIKVVGVGSVGTRCGIVLMMAASEDPIFLQIKEARQSVLEAYAGASAHDNRGKRVVVGQRIMQSASDIFLGWSEAESGRHFYVRQLNDAKLKPMVEVFDETTMEDYATLCGWVLAHAHSRSGDASMISGYMGSSDVFDEAVADFAEAYERQNQHDYEALRKAVASGQLHAQTVN
jgi:uncharacterized protein (DUF2252 family)